MKKIILHLIVFLSFYLPAFSANNFVPPYSHTFTDGCGKTWILVCNSCTSSSSFADAIDNWKDTHYLTSYLGKPCYTVNPPLPSEVPA